MKVFKGTFLVEVEEDVTADQLADFLSQFAVVDIYERDESPCGAVSVVLQYDESAIAPGLTPLTETELAALHH